MRRLRLLIAVLGLSLPAALLALAGCGIADPPAQQVLLRVQLNDSLARYPRVLVEVYSRADTAKKLLQLWDAPLASPKTQIPAYDVSGFGTSSFIVKVTAYAASGLVALRTRIFYSPEDGRIVRHDSLPPLIPQNWLNSLKPSVGALVPPFHPDSLTYLVKLPRDTSFVSFALTAPQGTTIQAKGETLKTGTTKVYQVGSAPDTLSISVTDLSTGSASSRQYRIALIPTPPLGLYLASLVPSTGRLGTEFTSENTLYNLYMPPTEDTVSFSAMPLDPKTMTMTIDGLAVFPGQQSQVITVAKGSIKTVEIYVIRTGQKGYYQITLDHTQTSSH